MYQSVNKLQIFALMTHSTSHRNRTLFNLIKITLVYPLNSLRLLDGVSYQKSNFNQIGATVRGSTVYTTLYFEEHILALISNNCECMKNQNGTNIPNRIMTQSNQNYMQNLHPLPSLIHHVEDLLSDQLQKRVSSYFDWLVINKIMQFEP